jgi:hypothetical protein
MVRARYIIPCGDGVRPTASSPSGDIVPEGDSFRGTNRKRILISPLVNLTMRKPSMKNGISGENYSFLFFFLFKNECPPFLCALRPQGVHRPGVFPGERHIDDTSRRIAGIGCFGANTILLHPFYEIQPFDPLRFDNFFVKQIPVFVEISPTLGIMKNLHRKKNCSSLF